VLLLFNVVSVFILFIITLDLTILFKRRLLHGSIAKALVNSVHGLLKFEIGGLKIAVMLQQSLYLVSIEYTYYILYLFCNELIRVIYSIV